MKFVYKTNQQKLKLTKHLYFVIMTYFKIKCQNIFEWHVQYIIITKQYLLFIKGNKYLTKNKKQLIIVLKRKIYNIDNSISIY